MPVQAIHRYVFSQQNWNFKTRGLASYTVTCKPTRKPSGFWHGSELLKNLLDFAEEDELYQLQMTS